jgi:antitoxin ParD1/3/4
MASINISLPDSMKTFLEEQAAKGGYGTTGEYLHALIREAQRREAKAKLEALLLEGLDSGPAIEITDEYWEQKRRAYDDRHRNKDGV